MDEDLDDTIEDIYNSMTDEQKAVVEYVAKLALESKLEQSAENEEDEAKPKSVLILILILTKTRLRPSLTKMRPTKPNLTKKRRKHLAMKGAVCPSTILFESNGPVDTTAGTTLTHEQVQDHCSALPIGVVLLGMPFLNMLEPMVLISICCSPRLRSLATCPIWSSDGRTG